MKNTINLFKFIFVVFFTFTLALVSCASEDDGAGDGNGGGTGGGGDGTCATPDENTRALIAFDAVAGDKVKIEAKQAVAPDDPNPVTLIGLEAIFTEISASSGEDKTIEIDDATKWKHIVQYKAFTACLPDSPNGAPDAIPDFDDLPAGKGIILPVSPSGDTEIDQTPGITELPDKLADVVTPYEPGDFDTTPPKTHTKTFFLGNDMVSIINFGQMFSAGGVAGEHLFYVCVQKTNGPLGALPDAILDCYIGGSFDASAKNFVRESTHEMPLAMSASLASDSADTSTLAAFSQKIPENPEETPDGILLHSEPWSVTAVSEIVRAKTTPVEGKAIEVGPGAITIAYSGVSTAAKDETTLDVATTTKWDKVLDVSFTMTDGNSDSSFDLHGITYVGVEGLPTETTDFKVATAADEADLTAYAVQDFPNNKVRSLVHLGAVGDPAVNVVNVYLGCISDVLDNSNNGHKLGPSSIACYVGADADISTLSSSDATSFSSPAEISIISVYPTASPGATDTDIDAGNTYATGPSGTPPTGYANHTHFIDVVLSPDLSPPPAP